MRYHPHHDGSQGNSRGGFGDRHQAYAIYRLPPARRAFRPDRNVVLVSGIRLDIRLAEVDDRRGIGIIRIGRVLLADSYGAKFRSIGWLLLMGFPPWVLAERLRAAGHRPPVVPLVAVRVDTPAMSWGFRKRIKLGPLVLNLPKRRASLSGKVGRFSTKTRTRGLRVSLPFGGRWNSRSLSRRTRSRR